MREACPPSSTFYHACQALRLAGVFEGWVLWGGGFGVGGAVGWAGFGCGGRLRLWLMPRAR